MATGSEDMQIDNNVVMDVEEFNPVNTDEVGQQENGATSLNDIEDSPQLLDVSVVSSVGDDVLPVSRVLLVLRRVKKSLPSRKRSRAKEGD